jgi:hypothetical protein
MKPSWKTFAMAMLLGGIYILYRKKWASPRGAIESFSDLVNDLMATGDQTTEVMRQVHERLPEATQIEGLKAAYLRELKPYLENPETRDYGVGLLDKVNYYFDLVYSTLNVILLDDVYPQQNVALMMDFQRKLLRQIDDFIFITGAGSSNLPEGLQKLRRDAETVFREVNLALATKVNAKDENKMNNITGFMPYPDDPLPYNTYYEATWD